MHKECKMEKTDKKITTYSERSLHAELKKRFCPDEDMHEVKIGRWVADACDGRTVYEVQTGSLSPLKKKIQYYLDETELNVVIVHPVARDRRIFWLDENGEMAKQPKKSPKHESIASGIADILYLGELFGRERLKICFAVMEVDEVRLLDGYGKSKKIRATSVDRLAGEIYGLVWVESALDVRNIIYPMLPEGEFSREELGRSLKLKGIKLWSAQKLLYDSLGLLECRKDGRRLVFEKKF